MAVHLRNLGLEATPFIHIHPASRWFFKCWTVERMAALIARSGRRPPRAADRGAEPDRNRDGRCHPEVVADARGELAGRLNLKELWR